MRTRHRRWLTTTTLLALSLVLGGTASAETLADAVALAYQNNPTLLAQRAQLRALDETYVQARAGWRPQLSLGASATYFETRIPSAARGAPIDRNGDGIPDSVGGGVIESNQSRIGLNFSQPIWTGGRVAANVSSARAVILQNREILRRTESQVLAAVIQAYVDVRRDQQTLVIQQENLGVLSRQLEEFQARFDVGELTRTDVAQSQARLSASQAQLQNARAQLAVSRAAYVAAVGQEPGELAPEPSLAYLLPANPDEAYEIAEKFNPTLRAQEYAADASRARLAGARADRLPTVGAQVSYAFTGPAIPEPPRDVLQSNLYSRGFTAAVSANVPLFAGGSINSRIRQQAENHNADRINIEAQRRAVLQGVTQTWNQLVANRANIVSNDEGVRAATIAAEGTRQEQQVGLRTAIDVLNAEQELRSAQLLQNTARRDEYMAAVNLLAVMGRLEARNLTPTVPQYDPKANFRRLRLTWGWVPWEEPISIVDSALTPQAKEMPLEAAIPPGLPPAGASAPSKN